VEWDTQVEDGRYVKVPGRPEHNWVWSPQGVVDMHWPERWAYLLFAQDSTQAFTLPLTEYLKNRLWEVLYREELYYQAHGQYAASLDALSVAAEPSLDGHPAHLSLEATAHTFKAFISSPDVKGTWSIDPNGNLER
jgi:hypothetical protein